MCKCLQKVYKLSVLCKAMTRKRIAIYSLIFVILLSLWMCSDSSKDDKSFAELVKVSLRDVGNKLLLAHNDSTSRVMPIVQVDKNKFTIPFEKNLAIEPGQLVSFVENSFDKAKLPKHYIIEVVACVNHEVVYSSLFRNKKEKSIVTCKGRILPEDCYTIDVSYKQRNTTLISSQTVGYIFGLFVLVFILDVFRLKVRKSSPDGIVDSNNYGEQRLGIFVFYPEQLKLVKEAQEINLSKKECELLAILVEKPNQVITREELTKRVWEDNGVFVGRSLDTYISKLRKKLKEDTSIRITNIHGVGYKLEILQ